ncbi:lysM and putative peptidoglycan-binding domain-containing protein 3 [Phymastichus coffea]|uniref:lysM and putative peptidoglycan-binding domain-containing protein 3 n=1 Tax=Phymastichus coffea TaxID=108790 RepID=UPI00273B7B5F|nr:lysM and putative peptidoglycan-binding domain-containing protein 3 [Phymastichus coffea]XP_058792313.1 lysM and putative peptidoglycan-binding domain-containing protein 3 [Phymastichus coffea]XP_058792314.1 lysM and putative peptidoglycan-binding domain-containing protein 3 [Phymastichus coffea]
MRKKSTSGTSETQKSGRHAYQRGNQKESSPYYVFLYSDDEKSENDEYPMQKEISSERTPRKIEVINIEVQSEDTLQALALRYQCTISELKRINKIHKDNEIHAHRTIKVPIQPFSLLTETKNDNSKTDQDIKSNLLINTGNDIVSKENEIINVLMIPTPSSSAIEINNIIMNSTVESLSQFNSECAPFVEDTETDKLISFVDYNKSNTNNNIVNTFTCSGADWGLSWYQVLCFSLLLGFAGPIIYVLYIAEHHNS